MNKDVDKVFEIITKELLGDDEISRLINKIPTEAKYNTLLDLSGTLAHLTSKYLPRKDVVNLLKSRGML